MITRRSFEEQKKQLELELVKMGEMVIAAVKSSVEALKNNNVEDAKKIIAHDSLINEKRRYIEEECISLIATQQPVACDLRDLIAIMNIDTELERMGDYAAGTANVVVMMGDQPLIKPLIDIPLMTEKATSMIERSLKAFMQRDVEAARALCHEDDDVDRLYDRIYHDLISIMIKDPKKTTGATYLMWVAHNLERIADRVTNICERTVYLVTGEIEESDVSKY